MSIDRREFVRAGLAGTAAIAAAGVSSACQGGNQQAPQAQAPPAQGQPKGPAVRGIVFNFTGLIAGELSSSKKALRLSLVKADKANVHEPHTALLVVPISSYVFPEDFGTSGGEVTLPYEKYQSPQIVRVGDQTLGVWGLSGCKLWLKDAEATFGAGDGAATLDFPTNKTTDVKKQPKETDADWAGLEWLAKAADLANATGDDPASIAIDAALVDAEVSMTRGKGASLMPVTCAERSRVYFFVGHEADARYHASEFKVEYAPTGDTTDLAIVTPHTSPGNIGVIRLRTPSGTPAAVSIANSPIGQMSADQKHFVAYSHLYKLKVEKDISSVEHACTHGAAQASAKPSTGPAEPNPPDPGCLIIIDERP